MNKPASELIALADRISGHLGPFNFITRAERELVVTTLRNAANQSGSERAGVDALREALQLVVDVSKSGADTIGFLIELQRVAVVCAKALATPPAQPAPAATHGKPDGAVREALRNMCDANGDYALASNAKNARRLEQCMREAEAALHSPKIAAAETSPGDVLTALDLLQLEQRGRAQAFRLLDQARNVSDPATLAKADAYEECGNELKSALSSKSSPGDMVECPACRNWMVERVCKYCNGSGEVTEQQFRDFGSEP